MNEFVKDRHEAFIEAIVNDQWAKVKAYSQKYGARLPKSPKIMKAEIYKAAQYCTDIPDEIKLQAMVKCLEMGFNPYIEEFGIPEVKVQ